MAVLQFLDALKRIEPFPNDKFINRLYNKARQCNNIAIFQANLPALPDYGEDQDSMNIDDVDATAHLQLLAEQAAVQGLSQYAPSSDKHDLRSCSNTKNTQITANTLFNQTSTMLYSEHVNWSLAAGNSPDLKGLRGNVDFVKGLDKELKSKHFITSAVRQDLINGDHRYTMALLFTYDYVHLGPGFTPHLGEDFASAPSGQLLTSWMPHILADLSEVQKPIVVSTLGKASSLVHALTGTGGAITPSVTPSTQVEALISMKIIPTTNVSGLSQLTNLDKDPWKSIADQNQVLWGNTANNWTQAVVALASVSTSSTVNTENGGQAFGQGMLMGLTFGLEDHQSWRTTTITGQDVANWIDAGRQQAAFNFLFTQDAPSVVDTHDFTTDGPAKSSCFIAGTRVAIEGGSVAIEELQVGTCVLTRADPAIYGVASDEDVVTPVPKGAPILCGLNNESPFFTPGHAFHTTSGLKAVDPHLAQTENPWLEVGKLLPGHILYRLSSDGKIYDQVEVQSISIGYAPSSSVYGVHLREGYRSYHANGYLVAVNYPEITVKSIATMLAQFPKHVQANMLYHINEIRPLFHKFGIATISDVLKRELRGVKRRPAATPVARRSRRRVTSHLRMAKRTYTLHETGSHNVSDYQLSQLSIYEGVVSLDGVPCARGIVDKSDRTIRWTRPVPDHGYEHGYVDVNNHGLAGHGAIILSQDADLDKLPSKESADHKIVQFQAAKPNVNVSKPTQALDHANMDKTMAALHSKRSLILNNSGHQLPSSSLASGKPLNIPGLKVGTISTPSPSPVNSSYIDNEDYWNLTLDQAVWPVNDKTKKGPSKPVKMGRVAFATYHAEGADGLSVPILVVPALDQLLKDINNAHLKGQTQLSSLYSSMVEITPDGLQMGTVYLDSAALLYQLADKPSGKQTLPSLLDVTFKGIGSSVKLPILFRTLGVRLSADFSSAIGAATEYNASNRGGDGDRHWVQDTDSSTPSAAAKVNRVLISKALATARPQPFGISAPKSAAPAIVTMQLSAETDLSVDILEQVPYNSIAVHNTSQTLLHNMMLYHMSSDDRETFLQVAQPGNLPGDLTINLESGLKKWIKNTYGPAFVDFMISQTKAKDVTWRDAFGDDEISKIWYWWNGQGKNCLSMTSEYNKLNAITSVYAMRQLYGEQLTPFIESPDPKGPTYWASQMFTTLTGNPHSMSNVIRKPINGGESILNKYCNIMLALDPTSGVTDKYFDKVVQYAIQKNASNPYFSLDKKTAENRKEWLNDGMKDLIQNILNNDPSITGDIADSLKQDLDNFMQAEGVAATQTAEEKATEIVTKSAELVSNIVQYMDRIGDGLQAIGRLSGFQGAAAVVNRGLSRLSNVGGFPYLKGVMLLVTTGMYIFTAVSTFSHWDQLSGSQRAVAIISTISMAIDVAGKSYGLYNDIKQWNENRRDVDLEPQEATEAAALDEDMGNLTMSEETMANLNATNQEVNNGRSIAAEYEEDLQVNEEQNNRSANLLSEDDFEEIKPGSDLVEEAKAAVPPADLPVAARGSWEEFATSENLLKCANIVVGVAFTIAMSVDLKDNWDKYTDVGKALNVLQITIQGLAVLVDATALAIEAGVSLGFVAADGILAATAMLALPIIGAVLAVIGLVVLFLLSFLDVIKPQQPPETPIEAFIRVTGRPLLGGFSVPPSVSLTYTAAPAQVNAGSSGALTVTATNKTGKKVTLQSATLTIEVGNDDAAMFSGPSTNWTLDAAYDDVAPKPLSTAGTIGAAPSTLSMAKISSQGRGKDLEEYDVSVIGSDPNNTGSSGPLVLDPGNSVTVAWLGMFNSAGSTTLQIVETLLTGDKCRSLMNINRV